MTSMNWKVIMISYHTLELRNEFYNMKPYPLIPKNVNWNVLGILRVIYDWLDLLHLIHLILTQVSTRSGLNTSNEGANKMDWFDVVFAISTACLLEAVASSICCWIFPDDFECWIFVINCGKLNDCPHCSFELVQTGAFTLSLFEIVPSERISIGW